MLKEIHNSIGRISIDGSQLTAWLATNDGFFLSAGHAFKKDHIGKKYTIYFDDGQQVEVELIDTNLSPEEGIDYSVLKADIDQINKNRYRFPVRIKLYEAAFRGKEYSFIGFPIRGHNFSLELDGGIVKGQSGNIIHLSNKYANYQGISGAPILVKIKNTYYSVALQSYQLGSKSEFLFASPFVLRNKYTALNKVIQKNIEYYAKNKLKPILNKEFKHFLNSNKNEFNNDRYNLFVVYNPLESSNKSLEKYFDRIYEKWEEDTSQQLISIAEKTLKKISRYVTGLIPIDINFLETVFENNISRNGIKNYISVKSPFISEGLYRVVVDLEGSTPLNINNQANNPPLSTSHVVYIKFYNGNELLLEATDDFNLIIKVPVGNLELDTNILCNIILDTYVDLLIFNSIKTLGNIFHTNELKRIFSVFKKNFAQAYSYKVYGYGVNEPISYISLASIARARAHGTIDVNKYADLWVDFINNFLFPSLNGNNVFIAEASDDVLQVIIEAMNLENGISEKHKNKLRQRISQFANGELLVAAVITSSTIKAPNRLKIQRGLKSLFGSYKINSCNIFALKDMRTLFSFHAYVKINLFING